jgi:hypothetical protein
VGVRVAAVFVGVRVGHDVVGTLETMGWFSSGLWRLYSVVRSMDGTRN